MKQAQNFAKNLSTKVGQPTEAKISKNLVFHWFLGIDTFFCAKQNSQDPHIFGKLIRIDCL